MQEIEQAQQFDTRKVVSLAGVLTALREDYQAGYLQSIEQLIHGNVFADFLMADELLQKPYKDPAAVLAGSVLEEHLRNLATTTGVPTTERERKAA